MSLDDINTRAWMSIGNSRTISEDTTQMIGDVNI